MSDYGKNCNDPQFSHEMHYKSEMRVNMNHGGSERPAEYARAHHTEPGKHRITSAKTERHSDSQRSADVEFAPGIIGNSNHKLNLSLGNGRDPRKAADRSPKKSSPKGTYKGGL
jgi:hypothetical protein